MRLRTDTKRQMFAESNGPSGERKISGVMLDTDGRNSCRGALIYSGAGGGLYWQVGLAVGTGI